MQLDYETRGLRRPSARPDIPGGPQTISEMLTLARARFAEREALIDRHARYTFAALDDAVNRAVGKLRALGVGPSDRVAASCFNSTDLVIAFLATQRIGAIWVGINRPLAPPEKAYIVRDAEVALFFGDAETVSQVPVAKSVTLVPGQPFWSDAAPAKTEGASDPHAPAAIAYTSGTSGFPKGAVHSQHNLLLPGAVTTLRGELGPDVKHGCVLPVTILNLMVLGPLVAFQQGAACVMLDRIDAPSVAEWIQREGIGYFAGVPTLLYDLLECAPSELKTLARVLIGGADSPAALCERYRERFGTQVIIGYGMTEAPTAVTVTDGTASTGLCGRALPQVEIQIVGEDDRVLPDGQVGEICVAPAKTGPLAGVYTPMLGYWNQPEATAKALRNGRFHSGDLGCLEAGQLYIRGRKSDLILRGGANVYPAEVERVLGGDARIAACAVVGRPDERLGERVVAFVQCKPDAPVTAEELKALCAQSLARYKVPEEFIFVDGFARNSMGKIIRRDLR